MTALKRCKHDIHPPGTCGLCHPPSGVAVATAFPPRGLNPGTYDRSTPWSRALELLDEAGVIPDDPLEVDPAAHTAAAREAETEQRRWWTQWGWPR